MTKRGYWRSTVAWESASACWCPTLFAGMLSCFEFAEIQQISDTEKGAERRALHGLTG